MSLMSIWMRPLLPPLGVWCPAATYTPVYGFACHFGPSVLCEPLRLPPYGSEQPTPSCEPEPDGVQFEQHKLPWPAAKACLSQLCPSDSKRPEPLTTLYL